MSDNDWDNGYAKAVGVLLDGEAISTPDRFGGRVVDDTFYVMLNASELDLPWTLPSKLRRTARHGDPGSCNSTRRSPILPVRRCPPTPPSPCSNGRSSS